MSLKLNNVSELSDYENEKIKFCFKHCKFKSHSEYSDKSKIAKFFDRMVIISNDYFKSKSKYFILNNSPKLKLNALKILKKYKSISIYDIFKGNNAFRVYGFFEKNIFYVLEFDLNP